MAAYYFWYHYFLDLKLSLDQLPAKSIIIHNILYLVYLLLTKVETYLENLKQI